MNEAVKIDDNNKNEEIVGVDKITEEDKAVKWQPKSR